MVGSIRRTQCWVVVLVGILAVAPLALGAPSTTAATHKVEGNVGAMGYLFKYGYMDATLNPETSALVSWESVREAIVRFQEFAWLNVTGELDEETIKMMRMPRCGVGDKVGFGSNARRKKRYSLQGSRWKIRTLGYYISKYPRELSETDVDDEIRKAFNVWEGVTDLKFYSGANSSQKRHIDILFESGEHGDGDPFDGVGGTLAHAFFPIYGGDVHFDRGEKWTIKSYRGTNLFQVAAHEIGHSLGLSHSDQQNALMAPFYRGWVTNFKLDDDDIKAIQSLYGKSTNEDDPEPVGTKPQTTKGNAPQDLCSDLTFDAIVTMADKETYVFKGDNYYKLTDDGIAEGYPRPIKNDFDLPSNLDAAFTWSNGKTYFFKGEEYWRFTDLAMDETYPKQISKGFSGIPDDVDGAFVWSGNGKIYFFKGTQYWRFDPSQRPPVKDSYPKLLTNWENIPSYLDGALQYSNGFTYFFKKGEYYRFNDRAFRVDTADPPFPRSTGYWWFGCPDSENLQVHPDQEVRIPIPGANDVYEDNGFDADGSQAMQHDNVAPFLSRNAAIRDAPSASTSASASSSSSGSPRPLSSPHPKWPSWVASLAFLLSARALAHQ